MNVCSLLVCVIAIPLLCVDGLNPIVLVPGDGGTQLFAKYKTEPTHLYCRKWSLGQKFNLWLNIDYFLPFYYNCFITDMKLDYDPITKTTRDPSHIQVFTEQFGSVNTVEYLSPFIHIARTEYFYNLINHLVLNWNYTRDKNIFGAPYDFRRALNELEPYIGQLTGLIEHAYVVNKNQKVIVLGHSMGNLFALKLLQDKPQSWKDRYVKSFISISGPYGGAMDALRTILAGNTEHVPLVSPLTLRQFQGTWPSTYFLLPTGDTWDRSFPLVRTPGRNYTIGNFESLFMDSNLTNAVDHFKDTKDLLPVSPPNVPVHCMYSYDMPTVISIDYTKSAFPDSLPALEYGQGDGTVNINSLQLCNGWKTQQKQPVTLDTVAKQSHLNILNSADFLADIDKYLSK